MRKLYFIFLLVVLSSISFYGQQITTNTSIPLEALIEGNLGQGCVDISNISSTVNGSVNGLPSYGYFESSNSNFPFQNGIMLSTGNANSAGNTLNTNPLNEGDDAWGTDSDLENALGLTGTLNATSIEFDFTSVTNLIEFNYLLASEEYFGTNPCQYSDGFAFLIKEAGTANPYTNIALIPNTTIPVNTNTIHDQIVGHCPAQNEAYFEGYNIGDTNYNGRTTVLTASAAIQPNVQYHIKLVIADQGDEFYDSAVFIEGNSFNASVNLGPDIVTCGQTVSLDGNIENPLATYSWFRNGVLLAGENNPTLDVVQSGIYKVQITIQLNNTSCIIQDEVVVTLNSEQSSGNLTDYMLCDDASNDGFEIFNLNSKDNEVLGSVPPSNYNISYHTSETDAENNVNAITNPYQNTSNPQSIYVRIEDLNNGCLAYSTFNLVVNLPPEINDPEPLEICDDDVADGFTQIYLTQVNSEITNDNPNLYVTYHYTQPDADAGTNQIYSPYTNVNPTNTIYVRVYDVTTGCYNTTTLEVTVLDKPAINTDDHWINSCEQDEDGFEVFDLTSIIDNVLGGLTGVTVSFHEFYDDAQNGVNPIADETNYQNVVQTLQIVYIRVEDDTTGCFTIVPLELHANIIQSGFNLSNFGVCDDASEDGIEDFSLPEIEYTLVNGYEGFEITFYETEDDQQNDTNPINEAVPYTVTSGPHVIYATIVSDECIEYVTINLEIHPPIDIQGLGSVDYCDTDNDGYASIFLETFNTYVSEGVNGANVKYFLTENDAINNENILDPYFYNTTNPQTLYVRVTNSQTSCYDIAPLEINVVGAPEVMQPTNIVICDDDQDGLYIIDLETKIPEIVSDSNGLDITFHTNYTSAYNDEDSIANPSAYNSFSQFIAVRVESESTGCFSIIGFQVYINTLPEFIPITNFQNCEADGNQIADFYFYLKDAEILNGQTGKDVLYFETAQDAIDRTNIIDKYSAYQNTSSPQTIYVRVENFTDINCFGTSQFDLEVGSLPLFNPPSDIFICDDISNDGIATVDLNDKILEISNGIPEDLDITFYTTNYNAQNNINPVILNYTNSLNPQQLYARIENGTYCHAIAEFEINVIQVPDVNTPSALEYCDTDYDGVLTFDLTISEFEILDVRQDDIVISYHETIEGAETDTAIITTPENYQNTSNPQTVYIKINNTVSNCYVTLPINLIVNLPPPINDFQTYEICDNENSAFDLTTINSVVTDDVTGIIFSYHTTSDDALNNVNPLDTNYTYSTTNDLIFIRLEYADTGCLSYYDFNLVVNPLPIANTPPTLYACDDDSNDGIEIVDLSIQNSSVLGTQDQNLFNITYYTSEASASEGINSLPGNYEAQHNEIIYVRIENNITGCYSTTQFEIIVNPYPILPNPMVNCDDDYDGITTFNLTLTEDELFTTPDANNSFTYFETLEDLNNNVNAIITPNNYTNLTNPQIVYIRVYNSLANCYNQVPLELKVNLPPAINDFGVFEICDTEDNTTDLSEINDILLAQTANVLVNYYPTETDAINQTNVLDNNYSYQTNNDVLYARVEFSTTHCYHIYEFNLRVNPLPTANQPINLVECDDDYDGLFDFNLAQQTAAILGGQNPNDFTVTYHETETSAIENSNPLGDIFTTSNQEIVYVRVENNTTGCYNLTEFTTILNPKPIVEIPDQVICLDNLPLIVSANTNNAGDTYLWSTNAISPEIEITEVGTYSVTATTPSGCVTTRVFNVTESETASIDLTEVVDFSDPNNVTITISGIGNYLYILDDGTPQESNIFENVTLGYHTITIIDLNGCAEVTKEVVVIDAPKFVTPNGDGHFDTWHITGVETLPGTIVYIFDRYGKLLKTLTSTSRGWDGTYNGFQMPASDYWFLAEVRKGDISFQVKGHFSLRL